MGREFDDNLGRSDGAHVAEALYALFEQDLGDWFYDGLWPYFLPVFQDERSRSESELGCRNAVSFLQSFRGAIEAEERGYIPADKEAWYTDWLLRLNVGEAAAEQATQAWLPKFRQLDSEKQLVLFRFFLSERLPKSEGQFFLLHFYALTLDLRVRATTATAFGAADEAEELHAEAVSLEGRLDAAIREYSSGGGVCYLLETDEGMLITKLRQYGRCLSLWSRAEYADEMNKSRCGGTQRISPISYRELEGQLQELQSTGMGCVALDQRMNGDVTVVPIGTLLQHVKESVKAVESSELGNTMKRALEE